MMMDNYYEILGVNTSATPQELRRAYRILARRYHPDVNPGKASQEKFRSIATAYGVLNDPAKRKSYDMQLESFLQATARAGARKQAPNGGAPNGTARSARKPETKKDQTGESLRKITKAFAEQPGEMCRHIFRRIFSRQKQAVRPAAGHARSRSVNKVSILEISLNVKDAVLGLKKTLEIAEPEGPRKISVRIPPGVRTGSVIRLKGGNGSGEEIVLIVRVAAHPFISLQPKGLVVEIPVSVNEAISGASITVPTLEEPVVIKIPPASQSGHEIRLKERGIQSKDGTRGDLIFRLMIRVPETPEALGLKDHSTSIDAYYASPVRQSFPKTLLEL